MLRRLELAPGGDSLVSAYREKNVDGPDRLSQLLACLRAVRDALGPVVPGVVHPRIRKRLEQTVPDADSVERIVFHEPFGLPDYVHLATRRRCTLFDSGRVLGEQESS